MSTRFHVLAVCAAAFCAACTIYHMPGIGTAPAGAARRFSRAEVSADVDTMLAVFDRVHPDLYAAISRDSLDRARHALVDTLPDAVTRDALYPGLARLVALIGDGHTSIGPPRDERQAFLANGGRVFPISVELDESDSLTVGAAIGGLPAGLRRGDRLLAVDGKSADSLLRALTLETSGESIAWRRRLAAQNFSGLLALHGINPPVTLTVRDGGSVSTVNVPGLTQDSVAAVTRARIAEGTQRPRAPNYTYRRLADGNAYIDFYSMGGDPGPFAKRLADTFAQIERDSARALIIDLRNNGGGDSRLGEAMINHFADRPYRMEGSKAWRASDDYRRYMLSGLNPMIRALRLIYLHPLARRFLRAPAGSNVTFEEAVVNHEWAQPRFTGPVCVLIGTGTFSSAMETADAIVTYHLATTLGEPTGGLPTAFGEVYYFWLPRLGLLASVSSAKYVRASGDTLDRGPVRPDIEIKRTAEDIRLGRDPVLERARNCASLRASASR